MRAAKEDAERVLGGVVMMYDQVRGAGWPPCCMQGCANPSGWMHAATP